jgi:uncharacterized integral membrane protein
MRETMAAIWAWTRIGAFGVVCLYALLVLVLNRNATIEPRLHLVFVQYDHPPALVVLIMTVVVSVVGLGLVYGFYRALMSVREIRRRRELLKPVQDRAEVSGEETLRPLGSAERSVPVTPVRRAPDSEPIPLEPPRPGT